MTAQTNTETLKLAHDWLDLASGFLWPLLLKSSLWAVLFGFAGLIVALFAMTWIHRRRLLRREHRLWNWAAKLSYLVVLGVCVVVGLISGTLYGIQKEMHRAIAESLQPALTAQMPALREQLAQRLEPMAATGLVTARDLVTPLVQDFLYQPKSDGRLERFKASVVNKLVLKVGAVAMNQAIHQALKQFPEAILGPGNEGPDDMATFVVGEVMKALTSAGGKLDFSPLDRSVPEIFARAVHKQLDAQFRGLYIALAVKVGLAALLIALEVLIYFKYYLPRRVAGPILETSHQAETASFVEAVSPDPDFTTCTVPIGNGEFLPTQASTCQ